MNIQSNKDDFDDGFGWIERSPSPQGDYNYNYNNDNQSTVTPNVNTNANESKDCLEEDTSIHNLRPRRNRSTATTNNTNVVNPQPQQVPLHHNSNTSNVNWNSTVNRNLNSNSNPNSNINMHNHSSTANNNANNNYNGDRNDNNNNTNIGTISGININAITTTGNQENSELVCHDFGPNGGLNLSWRARRFCSSSYNHNYNFFSSFGYEDECHMSSLYGMFRNDTQRRNNNNNNNDVPDTVSDIFEQPSLKWNIYQIKSKLEPKFGYLKIRQTLNDAFPIVKNQNQVDMFDEMLKNQCKRLISNNKQSFDKDVENMIG